MLALAKSEVNQPRAKPYTLFFILACSACLVLGVFTLATGAGNRGLTLVKTMEVRSTEDRDKETLKCITRKRESQNLCDAEIFGQGRITSDQFALKVGILASPADSGVNYTGIVTIDPQVGKVFWYVMPYFPILLMLLIVPLGKWPRAESGHEQCDRLLKKAAKEWVRIQKRPDWENVQWARVGKTLLQNDIIGSLDDLQPVMHTWLEDETYEPIRREWEDCKVPQSVHQALRFLRQTVELEPEALMQDLRVPVLSETFVVDEFERAILDSVPFAVNLRVRVLGDPIFERLIPALTIEYGTPRVVSHAAALWVIGQGETSSALLIQFVPGANGTLIRLRSGGARGWEICKDVRSLVNELVTLFPPKEQAKTP